MALVVDALASQTFIFAKDRIVKEQLKDIVEDLELEDIISIIFLYTHTQTNVSQIIELLSQNPRAAFLKLHNEKEWDEKLLETLVVTGIIDVIKKLGFTKDEIRAMKNQFFHNVHNVTLRLNRVIKSLYFLCKELNKAETLRLINKVNQHILTPIDEEKSHECLELHMLRWLQQNYFTIDEKNPNMVNLIKNLKITGCQTNLPVEINFDCWNIAVGNSSMNRNDSSTQNNQKSDNSNSLQFQNTLSVKTDRNLESPWTKDHKKLCIIVNVAKFYKGRLQGETRNGSEADVHNLLDTFGNCGFETEVQNNLTEFEMMLLLEDFDDCKYRKYGCIFLCILSHGYEGAVIFSDGENISLKTIEEKFCSEILNKTFKCIILQACQGKIAGIIDKQIEKNDSCTKSQLVADGPVNPMDHEHFLLFQATITNFMAFRDEINGSWFIQAVCSVIRESSPITVVKWIEMVTKRVKEYRGETKYKNKQVVQLPRHSGSMTCDYVIPRYEKITKN